MERPWSKRAEEIEAESSSIWNDLSAFEEWFSAQETAVNMDNDPIIDTLNEKADVAHIALYSIFCNVFDSMPNQSEVPHAN